MTSGTSVCVLEGPFASGCEVSTMSVDPIPINPDAPVKMAIDWREI